MTGGLWGFESKKEKYIFIGMIGFLAIMTAILFFPIAKAYVTDMMMGKTIEQQREAQSLEPSKGPQEYYAMFQCSCCGRTIGAGCCGMAKQRKAYVDELLLDDLKEDEIVFRMVKKFGFDVLMDQSREQEVRDYILSQAPENPPKIDITEPRHDFGTISQADGVVSTTFTIRNTGGSDLVIENMDTSCMCTSASLTYEGQESPVFGMSMHGKNPKDFKLSIPPGKTAQLNVFYDPMAHGKQKKSEMRITRSVTIVSNDPVDFQKDVRIELTQIP